MTFILFGVAFLFSSYAAHIGLAIASQPTTYVVRYVVAPKKKLEEKDEEENNEDASKTMTFP